MHKLEDITNKIIQGNCLSVLKNIPDNSIDCVTTSPPYWNQREYSTNLQVWGGDEKCNHKWDKKNICKCGAFLGELGSEPTPEQFVSNLRLIFKEIFRVLKPTGTVFCNLDDTFSTKNYGAIRKKSLCLIPQKFAIAMSELGFIIRNEIKWVKNNSLPESVRDRFTHVYEYIYFMVKDQKYYFEQQFEPMAESSLIRAKYDTFSKKTDTGIHGGFDLDGQRAHFAKILSGEYPGRNHRDILNVSTQGSDLNHFAVFPAQLIHKLISAGCPQFICTKCGEPRKKLYTHDGEITMGSPGSKTADEVGVSETSSLRTKTVKMKTEAGWSDCGCSVEFRPGIVLDPFMGSGTTGITAQKLGRNFIGCELNESYKKMAEKRIQDELGLFSPL